MKEEEKSLFESIYPNFEKLDIYLGNDVRKKITKLAKKEGEILKGLLKGIAIYNRKSQELVINVLGVINCSKYRDEDFVEYASKLSDKSKSVSKSHFIIYEGILGFVVPIQECKEMEIMKYSALHDVFLEKIHAYAICMVIDKNSNHAFIKPDGTILFEQ